MTTSPGRGLFDPDLPDRPLGRRIGFAVEIAATLGVIVAVTAVVLVLVRGRPVPGLALLLLPAVPVLAVGQLWTILLLRRRQRHGRSASERGWRPALRHFLPGLSLGAVAVLAILFYGGWLLAMLSFPGLAQGGPTAPRPDCPFPLQSHGAVTCVSEDTYRRAGAAGQRLGAAVLLGFFTGHLAVSRSERLSRRQEA